MIQEVLSLIGELASRGAALTEHRRITRFEMAPADGHGKVVADHVVAVSRRWYSNGGTFGFNEALCPLEQVCRGEEEVPSRPRVA